MNPNLASHVPGASRRALDLDLGHHVGIGTGLTPPVHEAHAPDLHELETLATWRISWHLDRYWFGPFCFDDLADAVRYARLQQAHAVPEVDD
ncbi:MAG: hypothetical protein RLZZ524_352 [Pseudomonadota bacterium]|jgi:hypothetical protein